VLLIKHFRSLYPDLYQSKTINLDFHSIPHFGDDSEMEKLWCGARGKALKGANTFFAQDSESDSLIYTSADPESFREKTPLKRQEFIMMHTTANLSVSVFWI